MLTLHMTNFNVAKTLYFWIVYVTINKMNPL
ncbi:Uncharacterised protein [Klebsiella variicola]|nr:Uncharacterised protein [Klebsiella variicola]